VKMINNGSIKDNAQNIHYKRYDLNNDGKSSLLIISGNGTVQKEAVDTFEDVQAIYVCKSISDIEPHSFRDIEGLKILVISADIDSPENDLPMQTDMFFIEDCFAAFTDIYI
ncbi:MAG: hypothetical protein K2N26_10235, partial [Oscillospiraceae bacterium]|nr:hypothetical protein [Oscillospiraceae bacterium]